MRESFPQQFFQLKPKTQICEGSFRDKETSKKLGLIFPGRL